MGGGGTSRLCDRIGRGYLRGCIVVSLGGRGVCEMLVWIGGGKELCHFWGEFGN